MTLDELEKVCLDSLNHPERSGGYPPLITLASPDYRAPFGRKVRGTLLYKNSEGKTVWHYRADRVLALVKKLRTV